MSDGLMLPPGAGQPIGAGLTLKVGDTQARHWSVFEAEVGPGFDVGAHLHRNSEELFYVLAGELELLAFEPRARTSESGSWRGWQSADGARVARAGPGSVLFVPAGCPHAFANPGPGTARMLFLVAPPGHEHYQREIADLLAAPRSQDTALGEAIAEIRERHDIQQLTPPVAAGRAHPGPAR